MGTLHIKLVFVEKYTLTNFLAVLDHSKTIMCCHLLPNFKSIKIIFSTKFINIIWRWVGTDKPNNSGRGRNAISKLLNSIVKIVRNIIWWVEISQTIVAGKGNVISKVLKLNC